MLGQAREEMMQFKCVGKYKGTVASLYLLQRGKFVLLVKVVK